MDARLVLEDVMDSLRPGPHRAKTIERLEQLFRAGSPPDPALEGFLPGRLVTLTVWGPLDRLVRGLTDLWMPWRGKSFEVAGGGGVNIMTSGARLPLRLWFPSHRPEQEGAGRIRVFPFRTRVGPGEVDDGLDVLKIDYDFEANPAFIVRRILDELVQVADGLYLGRVLCRWRGLHRPIGFFSLERE